MITVSNLLSPHLPPKTHQDFVWIIAHANEAGTQKAAHCKYCGQVKNLEWVTYQVGGATKWVLVETIDGRLARHKCEAGTVASQNNFHGTKTGHVSSFGSPFKVPKSGILPEHHTEGFNVSGWAKTEADMKMKLIAMQKEHEAKYEKQNWKPKKVNK